MPLSFAKNNGPMIIGVVRRKTARDAIADARNCECHGATGIDLHLSTLEEKYQTPEELKKIFSAIHLPVLSLNYNMDAEFRPLKRSDDEKVALLLRAIEAGTSAVDIEGHLYTGENNGNAAHLGKPGYSFLSGMPKGVITDEGAIEKQKALIERVHGMGAEVLISTHTKIPMSCDQVVELALFLEQRNPDVIKIVTTCENDEQLAEAFRTMLVLKKEVRCAIHFHCSGAAGRLTRMVNPALGAYLAFCNDGYHAGTDFEQLDLETASKIIPVLKGLTR